MASPLGALVAAAGTGLLQRTYLLRTKTQTGLPQLLIVFDAITEETPEFTADVTQHPVEEGPEVSDHIQLKNPTLSLKGTISNNPLDLQTTIANLAAGGLDLVTSSQFRANILNTGLQQAGGIAGATLLGNASNPAQQGIAGAADAIARSALLSAFEQRLPFDVITKRQRYENMVIERLAFPRDSNTGFQLVFEIDMIRLRTVSTLTVQIDEVSENVITSATKKTNLGSQVSKGVSTAAASGGMKSLLRNPVTKLADVIVKAIS
jgi:hypothetical protein